MYALLAILLTFCPRRVDENVAYILRQEHADKIASMQAGEAESLFVYACPKFVTPSVPDYGHDELLVRSLRIFLFSFILVAISFAPEEGVPS